jgi:hypothetical protein
MEKMVKPIRPQIPQDTYGLGGGYFTPGKVPAGGFNSMWCFDGSHNPKKSPTSKPEKNRG